MSSSNKRSKKASSLAPLAPLFYALNWIAFFGWSYILLMVGWTAIKAHEQQQLVEALQGTVLIMEGICVIEVLRIAMGDAPGNLVLGMVLHAIRITVIMQVLPRATTAATEASFRSWPLATAVLGSWAITEVTRYPMYMFPSSQLLRSIRMVVPLVTFPVGAMSEFISAHVVLFRSVDDASLPWWLQCALVLMMLVQGVLGPTLAYPALLKKGLPVLGLGKPAKRDKKSR